MIKDRELNNLTKAQVEALLECFDFLLNGYEEKACFEVDDVWVIHLKHTRNYRVIRVFIHPNDYRIEVAGHTRKRVFFSSSDERYRIIVNSERSVGVIKFKASASLM